MVFNEIFDVVDNFTKYAYVNIGKRKYRTGNLFTIPYTLNGDVITINNDTLNIMESFLTDGNVKILRNTVGILVKCKTFNIEYKYKDEIIEQPFTISFDIVEVK